jgi:hypothetical protein
MSCTSTCRKPNGNQAHCGSCHQTFAGITGFDHHRVGQIDERVCVAPAERGMHLNAYGVWSLPSSGAYWADPQPSGDAVAAELPSGVAEDTKAICGHCGGPQRGYATVNRTPLCHPDTGLDCYSLVTISGHPMPCDRLDADRRYCEAVDDFFVDIAGEQP